MRASLRWLRLVIASALLACGGCALPGSHPIGLDMAQARPGGGQSPLGRYIKHVVIVIQENRSFENFFAGFPGADAPMNGRLHSGKLIRLHRITFDDVDFAHSWHNAVVDWDHGKMDGFSLNRSTPPSGPSAAYAYLDRSQIAPYWTMARRYVLADAMFPTEFGPSFTAHLDLIASTANLSPSRGEVNYPSALEWSCEAPPQTTTSTLDRRRAISQNGPFPCFTQFRTLADTLDAAHVPWRYYAPSINSSGGVWSAFSAIRPVFFGPDWNADVISPQTRVLEDAKAGRLAAVSWVVPDALDSDHPALRSDTGPSWVAGVVNAIGEGKDWNTTAIVVLWDDWGGWYDNADPPQLDFAGLGIRVGCIIISPYARRGYVSHTRYEFGSVLKFVEEAFGLPPLGPRSFGYTDARANSILDAFDFTKAPHAFEPISAPYPAGYFLQRAPSRRLPDTE
jgi:phospholipase C